MVGVNVEGGVVVVTVVVVPGSQPTIVGSRVLVVLGVIRLQRWSNAGLKRRMLVRFDIDQFLTTGAWRLAERWDVIVALADCAGYVSPRITNESVGNRPGRAPAWAVCQDQAAESGDADRAGGGPTRVARVQLSWAWILGPGFDGFRVVVLAPMGTG